MTPLWQVMGFDTKRSLVQLRGVIGRVHVDWADAHITADDMLAWLAERSQWVELRTTLDGRWAATLGSLFYEVADTPREALEALVREVAG